LIGADFAFGAALARLLERGRPQQAADMIGAKRRLGSLHAGSPDPQIVTPGLDPGVHTALPLHGLPGQARQ
jgi:hypothetical protein